ncbi:MAG: hypothetical protein IIV90_00345, partial [Oscillospiraceae bacterium]|nr:hypothetical protein [Oscillospiraceae bacterium]
FQAEKIIGKRLPPPHPGGGAFLCRGGGKKQGRENTIFPAEETKFFGKRERLTHMGRCVKMEKIK